MSFGTARSGLKELRPNLATVTDLDRTSGISSCSDPPLALIYWGLALFDATRNSMRADYPMGFVGY
jgi:hypothetical protein